MLLKASTITKDELFDGCYDAPNHILFLVDGGSKKDCFVRQALAENKGRRFINVQCHDGRMEGKFRIIPVGYMTNLTQKFGAKLKRGEADWVLFDKWKNEDPENPKQGKDPYTTSAFKRYAKTTSLYKCDYVIELAEYEFKN